jgi:rhodanese-related sulfurtransferase
VSSSPTCSARTDADHEQVQELSAAGAQLVEMLPREEYEEEHLPEAIDIPLKELGFPLARYLPQP